MAAINEVPSKDVIYWYVLLFNWIRETASVLAVARASPVNFYPTIFTEPFGATILFKVVVIG